MINASGDCWGFNVCVLATLVLFWTSDPASPEQKMTDYFFDDSFVMQKMHNLHEGAGSAVLLFIVYLFFTVDPCAARVHVVADHLAERLLPRREAVVHEKKCWKSSPVCGFACLRFCVPVRGSPNPFVVVPFITVKL